MAEMCGIDVSKWQAGISSIGALKPRPAFVICKATGGTGYVDPECDRFIQECIRLGIPWGFYHFADDGYGLNPVAEADFFVKNTKNYFGHGIPVLDWEPGDAGNVSAAKAFLDRVHELTGYKPIIYMNASTENGYDWSPVVAGDYGLWLAGYPSERYIQGFRTSAQYPCPYHLKHWSFALMWQYTSAGRLEGYAGNLDCNQFYGDTNTWAAYVGSGKAPKPAPVSTPVFTPTPTADVNKLAYEVIAGKHGNGEARVAALGTKYVEVQKRVNEILTRTPNALDMARAVIRGEYGNGETRKARLGASYADIQGIVNELI